MYKIYKPTTVEKLVSNLLHQYGIKSKNDLCIESLSVAFKIKVAIIEEDTCMVIGKRGPLIIIDSRLSELQQYAHFLHELAHFIMKHSTFQMLSEYQWNYIELKADYVINYIAMPYFLINKIFELETVEDVSKYFFVPYKYAEHRMENIKSRLLAQTSYNNIEVVGRGLHC